MSGDFFPQILELVYLMGTVSILACQFIGVILLAKVARNLAWWILLAGTILTVIGSLGTLFTQRFLFYKNPTVDDVMILFQITGAVHTFGALLFFVGFLIHAALYLQRSRRNAELESIIAVQAEEIQKLSK